MSPTQFSIGEAVKLLKSGSKMARGGWNGKMMFIYYVPAASYPAVTEVAKKEFGDMVPYREYFAHKAVDGIVGPFTFTNSDVLAGDWYVV